jgi:sterol desaturase/sphingolipid hydroxylase (fatty acid hydroxylase superfamily)
MTGSLTEHEAALRLAAFTGVFAAVALWEWQAPRRRARFARAARWPHNVALLVLDALVVRLLAPGAAIAVALAGESRGWGLLATVALSFWAEVVIAIVLLDLAIYFQHVVFHAVPALWRLHRVHHADPDFDVTTGTRFHPLEILLSLGIKCAAVAAIGAPSLAVLVFEIVLNATAMFNHANARLPASADRWLRWLVVTPDMHRVHHSALAHEMNGNFGFNVPWWDRLLGTYRAQPAAGHEAMRIGVDGLQHASELRIGALLTQPFRAAPAAGAVDRVPAAADALAGVPLIERKQA